MSNETKRDVFEKTLTLYRSAVNVMNENGLDEVPDIPASHMLANYDAALPDDLPVIPKAIGEYIEEVKAHGKWSIIDPLWRVGDALSAMGESGLGDRSRWVLHHSDDFALAWVLGVWRVEETGEIVKLEAEK